MCAPPCASVGCNDYNDVGTNVVRIILDGLNQRHPLYAATIAQLKAKFHANPTDLTLTHLEELFFNIDDNASGYFKNNGKLESANYIYNGSDTSKRDLSKIECYNCGKKGHMSRDCQSARKSSTSKITPKSNKDKSHITCHLCKEKAHYANECPKRSGSSK